MKHKIVILSFLLIATPAHAWTHSDFINVFSQTKFAAGVALFTFIGLVLHDLEAFKNKHSNQYDRLYQNTKFSLENLDTKMTGINSQLQESLTILANLRSLQEDGHKHRMNNYQELYELQQGVNNSLISFSDESQQEFSTKLAAYDELIATENTRVDNAKAKLKRHNDALLQKVLENRQTIEALQQKSHGALAGIEGDFSMLLNAFQNTSSPQLSKVQATGRTGEKSGAEKIVYLHNQRLERRWLEKK